MTKRIMTMFLLLALAGLFYAMTAKANGGESPPTPTAQPSRTPTPTTAPPVCHVHTGMDGGAVNLRTCAGVSCAVLDIVTEGERLTILTAGNWTNVTTEDGVTGYINSKYCKGN